MCHRGMEGGWEEETEYFTAVLMSAGCGQTSVWGIRLHHIFTGITVELSICKYHFGVNDIDTFGAVQRWLNDGVGVDGG